jgi:prevent-host-death family protein
MYDDVHLCTLAAVATTMTVSEARAALPQVLDRVLAGEEVTITRHGQPVAVVVRPDRLRSRRADAVFAEAEGLRERLDAARRRPLGPPTMTPERAEELIADIRAGRSRR